jgi:DnaJ-class molecular chaperone
VNSTIEVTFFCDYCGGTGEVLAPAQWSDEPRYEKCVMCNGYGVRTKQIALEQEAELYDFLPEDYDPFAVEEEAK